MSNLFVRDIRDGLQGTGVKAARSSARSRTGMQPGVERVLRAVAQRTARHVRLSCNSPRYDIPVSTSRACSARKASRRARASRAQRTPPTSDHLTAPPRRATTSAGPSASSGTCLSQRVDTVVEMWPARFRRPQWRWRRTRPATTRLDGGEALRRMLVNWNYFHSAGTGGPALPRAGVPEARSTTPRRNPAPMCSIRPERRQWARSHLQVTHGPRHDTVLTTTSPG